MTRALNWLDRRNLHPIGSLHRRGHYSICYGPHLDWLLSFRLILFTSIDWQRRRDLHLLDLRFERPTARLLGARRHQVAPRLGLAPRSFRLTGERITLILPRNKKLVPTAGIAPAPSASQAAALSAELRGNKAKGTPAGSPDASNVTGAFPPKEIGGDGGNRTHSLNLARIGRRYDCHPPKWHPRQVSHPDLPH
jgi:hypothetical protein